MKRIIIVSLSIILAFAASCKKEAHITSNPQEQEISAGGGSLSFTITANYPWQAKSEASWIKVSAADGSTLTVTVESNSSTDPREGGIVLTCENKTLKVSVRQAQKNAVEPDDGDTISVNYEEQDKVVSLKSNTDFTVDIPANAKEWISAVKTKAMVAGEVTLRVKANESTAPREALLVFKDDNGISLRTISVLQSGAPQMVYITHTLSYFPSPMLFGFGLTAITDWGDGKVEQYSYKNTHTYTTGGEHTVKITATEAQTITVNSLEGIESVDLSGFLIQNNR